MDEIRKVAERLWAHLGEEYGSKVLHVILYGSPPEAVLLRNPMWMCSWSWTMP